MTLANAWLIAGVPQALGSVLPHGFQDFETNLISTPLDEDERLIDQARQRIEQCMTRLALFAEGHAFGRIAGETACKHGY